MITALFLVGKMSASLPTRDAADVGLTPLRSTLVDARRHSWTTHPHRWCVTPFDLWVDSPARFRR